ncbi:MAG: single-stranded DNA-binding protein [Thermoplasmata archaeon HGW-Thermoplasmata-2]|nr:MAG: single-stranded DNA-binding protein [Thermoplasmata archaeon HGW-Thermoplasmata-2]
MDNRTNVKDLTPQSKQVNILAKVVSVGEAKEIPNKFGGEARKVAEAVIGDETGIVTMSLWQEQIGTIAPEEVLAIENGYVSLVQGHVRLNVGKYGKMAKVADAVTVNSETDASAATYEQERRAFSPRRSFGGGGGYGGERRGGFGGERRGGRY